LIGSPSVTCFFLLFTGGDTALAVDRFPVPAVFRCYLQRAIPHFLSADFFKRGCGEARQGLQAAPATNFPRVYHSNGDKGREQYYRKKISTHPMPEAPNAFFSLVGHM
jgi:hypothetical protein